MRKKTVFQKPHLFFEVYLGLFLRNPRFFSKTRKNRSEIASSFPAVARLDLSHVSENKGFGKTHLYVIKTKIVCYKDKMYML